MLALLFGGDYAVFFLLIIVLILSLSFHEFGHAFVAKLFGDNTAELAGRLTINPLAHIDPMGMLLVVMVGFGYAKPVPTNPRNFTSRWASPLVAFAGPAMNFLLAVIAINIYIFGLNSPDSFMSERGPAMFLQYMAVINILLMLFNLIPLGALDGHYILPYFLSKKHAHQYMVLNDRYGNQVLFGLIILSVFGVPIFSTLFAFSRSLLPYLVFI